MANDSIELGRIRAKVLRLEDKTDKLTIVNTTASFDQTVSITGNLYVNGELLNVSVADVTSALSPYATSTNVSSSVTSSVNTLKTDLTASYARLAIANIFSANQTITGTLNASSNISGNANLIIGGNTGIGTTTALEKLHVVGNAIIGTTFNGANGYPSSDLIVHVADATGALGQENAISIFRQQSADSWPQIATMTIGRYETGTTEARTRLDFNLKHANVGTDTAEVNVMSLNSAGRVGVGTASPARQLSVVGQFSVVSGAVGEDTAYNGTIISTKTGSSNQHINIIRAGNHVRSIGYVPNSNTFLIAGGEATDSNFGNNIPFSIDSSGRVGIGTTSPSTKLTIVDNSYPSAFISSSHVSSNKVYTSIQYGATAVNGGGDIGYVYDNATPANSFFHITPWGQAQGSALSVKPNRYVGVYTSNPQYPLEVNGNVGISGHIYLQTNSDSVSRLYKPANYRLDFNAGTNFWTGMHFTAEHGITYDGGLTYSYPRTSQYWGYDNNGVSPSFINYYNWLGNNGSTNPNYIVGLDGTGRYAIFTAGAEKLTVLANGNVGINNSNPGDKFGVYENTNGGTSLALRNLNAGSSAYSIIQIGNDTAANKLVMFTNSSTRTADGGAGNTTIRTDSGKLLLGAGGSTYHALDTNGNVGIGITNPATKLDVAGTIKSGRTDTANEGGEIQLARAFDNAVKWTIDAFGSGDGSAFRIFDNTGSVAFYINPTNRYVGLGGNVNFTPTVPLHIKNANSTYTNPEDNNLPTVFASNTSNASTSAHAILGTRVGGASGGDPFISFDISGVTGWSIGVDNSDSDKFKISNAWNDVGTNTDVTIQTDGNVGIGTSSPTSKLQVAGGDALINGVKVGAGGGNSALNACLGFNALDATAGSYVTAIGRGALSSSTGAQNTAVGGLAGNVVSTGTGNTAIGYTSLYNLTTGTNNTALGTNALRYLTAGTNNTTSSNCTGVGYDARITANNQVQLGDSTTTTYAYGAVQNRSDIRDKADIEDTNLGLDFINLLRPVQYCWDYREDYFDKTIEKVKTTLEDGTEVVNLEEKLVPVPKDGSRKRKRKHQGLIAQEVKEVMDKLNIDFAGYQDHKINGGLDVLSMGYTEFIGPLIKSVQELSSENDYLKNKLEEKDKQINDILSRLVALENK